MREFTFKIEDAKAERLTAIAHRRDVTVGDLLRQILDEFFKEEDKSDAIVEQIVRDRELDAMYDRSLYGNEPTPPVAE